MTTKVLFLLLTVTVCVSTIHTQKNRLVFKAATATSTESTSESSSISESSSGVRSTSQNPTSESSASNSDGPTSTSASQTTDSVPAILNSSIQWLNSSGTNATSYSGPGSTFNNSLYHTGNQNQIKGKHLSKHHGGHENSKHYQHEQHHHQENKKHTRNLKSSRHGNSRSHAEREKYN